jgi:hypothetical protein
MRHNLKLYVVLILAAVIISAGAYSAQSWPSSENGAAFAVYYTAASLVRSNMDPHIYDGSERHINPQLMFADPNTVFARTAGAHGISTVMLYIYPPTLADLLVPLTLFSPATALIIWNLLT